MRELKVIFLGATLLPSVLATCYFPDGTESSTDVACDSGVTDSFCCYKGQACLSTKICLTNPDDAVPVYARGTCTDQNWESSACPNFCLDTQSGSGNPMYSCNTTADEFCCNDGCSCKTYAGYEIVSYSTDAYTLTIIGEDFTQTHTSSASTTSSAATSFSTSTLSSGSSTALKTASAGSSVSSVNSASQTSSSTSEEKSTSNSSSSTKIGIGLGVGLGVPAIAAAIGYFVWRSKRRRPNLATEQIAPVEMDPRAPFSGYAAPMPYKDNSPEYKPPLKDFTASEMPAREAAAQEMDAGTDGVRH
ncbi:MAG: hypothetical protein M1834_005673 [Cirrosporium novae-zelandiae]|nr:MAG: hypothetical protein M1834_005673 [Cirrosporium novae-zelandiae]